MTKSQDVLDMAVKIRVTCIRSGYAHNGGTTFGIIQDKERFFKQVKLSSLRMHFHIADLGPVVQS